MARLASWLPALVALTVGLWFALAGPDFPLDDAWIHLSYAKSLQLGQGLSYNPRDYETGASSPLWALLLALLPLHGAPLLGVRALGVLLHALLAACTAQLTFRLLPERSPARTRLALAAGLLCATEPLLAQASVSGMEVTLTALLLMLMVRALQAQHVVRCAVWAALSVWARPEALPFVALLCVLDGYRTRSPKVLLPAAAAACALGVWVLYDLLVSGYAWPNTKYAKAGGLHLSSLAYFGRLVVSSPLIALALVLTRRLLGQQAAPAHEPATHAAQDQAAGHAGMLAGIAGPRALPASLLFAWLGSLLAIALSRPLHPGLLLYQSRYFAVLAALPCVLVALGLGRLSARARNWAPAALAAFALPMLLLSRAQLAQLEQDIATLHTGPARYVAQQLPPDARVLAEGAGALRYFTPRSMHIIDMLGLNQARIVHARGLSRGAYHCALLASNPEYALVPVGEHMDTVVQLFHARTLRTWSDPHYTQGMPARSRSVSLLQLAGAKLDCSAAR